MDIIIKLGILVAAGLIGGRLANLLKLPSVSGYIVAGLLVGPSVFDFVKSTDVESLSIINDMALGAIAFTVGSEFLLKEMKSLGKKIAIITIAESLGAIILVFSVMYLLFKQSFEFSLVLASMAASTAPAGVIMVIRELKARGPIVKTLLPIVALDDAIGIIVFGLAISIAKITSGIEKVSGIKMISAPLIEIFGSLMLGVVFGLILSYIAKRAKNRDELLSLVVGSILLITGIASYLGLSPLLTNMMMGGVLVNTMQNSKRVFDLIGDFTPPIYLLFFAVAGSSLNLNVLSTVGAIGIGFVLARIIGKTIGAAAGSRYVKADSNVVKYLGLTLLPQGGVAIGLSMLVGKELPQFSSEIIAIILFSVLVFEIAGPITAKIAFIKGGEVNTEVNTNKSKSKVSHQKV